MIHGNAATVARSPRRSRAERTEPKPRRGARGDSRRVRRVLETAVTVPFAAGPRRESAEFPFICG